MDLKPEMGAQLTANVALEELARMEVRHENTKAQEVARQKIPAEDSSYHPFRLKAIERSSIDQSKELNLVISAMSTKDANAPPGSTTGSRAWALDGALSAPHRDTPPTELRRPPCPRSRLELEQFRIKAVISQKSNFGPKSRNATSAGTGLMQLDPRHFGNGADLTGPALNIDLGTKELRRLLDKFGGVQARALTACNLGEYPDPSSIPVGRSITGVE